MRPTSGNLGLCRMVRWGGLGLALLLCASPLWAQKVKENKNSLDLLAFAKPETVLTSQIELLDTANPQLSPATVAAWQAFAGRDGGGQWTLLVDRVTGKPALMEGKGVPWIPGTANALSGTDFGLPQETEGKDVPLQVVEAMAREFLYKYPDLLGVDPSELQINKVSSGPVLDYLYFIHFDWAPGGVPVEGAQVVFRLNHGNMAQFGLVNVCESIRRLDPRPSISLDTAWQNLWGLLGGSSTSDEIIEPGRMLIIPVSTQEALSGAPVEAGRGMEYRLVYVLGFRRPGVMGTWEARVDAQTGEVLVFRDANMYGSIHGGAYPNDRPAAEVDRPFPFADIGGGSYADAVGNFWGTSATVTLNGRYVKVSDGCGAISLTTSTGDANFRTGTGTDCTVPSGNTAGAGNTHAARTQYYQINLIKMKALTYLPSNDWLQARLTDSVNISVYCNAYWDGVKLNFFKADTANYCANTGEIPGVSLHEWGHGMDSNDGSPSGDNGTGETYGDFSAVLQTHNSCAGNGFDTRGTNCTGYGDACTACSGVRDIDYRKHATPSPHFPQDLTSNTCTGCTTYACGASTTYPGPCSREGHCESYISSEALWDLAAWDLQQAPTSMDAISAWQLVDRLWYASRSTVANAYSCPTVTTSHGMGTTNYFAVFRFIDDDNGNLTDGTPHSRAIYDAFNRHKIACNASGAGICTTGYNINYSTCPTLGKPGNVAATAKNNEVLLSWDAVTGATRYFVFRNETGCGAGFTKIATVATTAYEDNLVVNGVTYYYRIQAATNSDVCVSPMSGDATTCTQATPAGTASARYKWGSATVTADSGDSDGFIDNCETITVQFTVINDGNVALTGVQVTSITSDAANFSLLTTLPINVGSLAVGAESVQSCQFVVRGGLAFGGTLILNFSVLATQFSPATVTSHTFNLTETNKVFTSAKSYSFEADNDGWTFYGGFQRLLATTTSTPPVCPGGGSYIIRPSAQGTLDVCDRAKSPYFIPTTSTTMTIYHWENLYAATTGTPAVYIEGANVHLNTPSAFPEPNFLAYPTSGDLYQTDYVMGSGYMSCVIAGEYGWTLDRTSWISSSWGTTVFNPIANKDTRIELSYGAYYGGAQGPGFYFDRVELTNIYEYVADTQTNTCPSCQNPTSVSVTPDGPITECTGIPIGLTAAATGGTAPLAYQWYDGASPISGATASTYNANGTAGSHSYNCRVTGNGCSDYTADAAATQITWYTLAVDVTPNGTTAVCNNTNITFTATASGGSGYLYQWTEDGNPINNETNSTLTIKYNSAVSHTYNCGVVSSECDTSVDDPTPSTGQWDPQPNAVSISGISDNDACAQSGLTVSFSGGSGATSFNLLRDSVQVATGITSPYVYIPGDTASHSYVVRALAGGCARDSSSQAASDANGKPGAPNLTSITDPTTCLQTGIYVNYTAGSGAASHDLYRDGARVVTGYTSGALYNPGDTANHAYIVRAVNGTCTTDSNSRSYADTSGMPGAPSINTITDNSTCVQDGIHVNYTAGSLATSHDLYRDSISVVTGYVSGALYNPGDTSSHSYVVRATNICGTADSTSQAFTDSASGAPGAPSITSITDNNACAQDGIRVNYTAGTGADSHDLYRDGSRVVTGYSSGVLYNPGDIASHTYIVRAVKGTCTTDSSGQLFADANNTPTPTITGGSSNTCPSTGVTLSTQAYSAYQWNLGGAPIGGATEQTYAATTSGTYSVTVTQGGCQATSAGMAVTISACMPQVQYDSFAAPVEICGDGDTAIEPGEEWSVAVTLRNTGNGDAQAAVADLAVHTGSPVGATITGDPGNYGTISAGGTAQAIYTFIPSESAACGSDVQFDVVNIASVGYTYPGSSNAFAQTVGSGTQTENAAQVTTPLSATSGSATSDFTPNFSIASADTATVNYTLAFDGTSTATLNPEADSWVNQASTGTNYGTASTMIVRARNNQNGRSVLRFNLSSIPTGSNITSATLRIYGAGTVNRTHNVHSLNAAWVETTITWTNAPAYNTTVAATTSTGTTTGWKAWTVTSLVQGWVTTPSSNYGLLVKDGTEGGGTTRTWTYNTWENAANKPELVITYTRPGNVTNNTKVDLLGPGGGSWTLKNYTFADPSKPIDVKSYYNDATGGPGLWRIQVSENTGGKGILSSATMQVTGRQCTVSTTCKPPVSDVQVLTARSTSATNKLEWLNPGSPYGQTRVVFKNSGYPLTPTDGTVLVNQVGTAGAYGTYSHEGLTNGTTFYYTVFVNSAADGSGSWSRGKNVKAKPIDTSGALKWSYSTGATAVAQPGVRPGAIGAGAGYEVSNDRVFHAMNPTAAGGDWPKTSPFNWAPTAMNAPAQHRPPVLPLSAGPRAFLASQDGYAYCIDARTGAKLWETSSALGTTLQANPAGFFTDLGATRNLLFVGSRNSSSANTLWALDPATGAVNANYSFTNSVAQGGDGLGIGIITGLAVDRPNSRLYFTSRARGGGSANTVWCVSATGATVQKVWAVAVGDIDGSPIPGTGVYYVGNNTGIVYALDPATGATLWTYGTGDGAIKGFIWPLGTSPDRLLFSTTNKVWAIQDNGTNASKLWDTASNVPAPSTPLVFGSTYFVVGGGDGTLYQIDRTTGSVNKSLNLTSSALGSPGYDGVNRIAYVGSTAGNIYAVQLPLP